MIFSLFTAFPQWATWLFAGMAALVAANTIQRIIWARHHLHLSQLNPVI